MVEPERTPADPDEQSLDCTLDSFLSEWRCELHRPREKEANGGHLLGKRERAEHVPVSQQDSLEDLPGAAASRKRAVPIQEPSPLLVLPPPGGGGGERAVAKVLVTASGVQRSGSASDAVGTRLVDRLIADLDEVNTVPFFEVQLPREVALLIFSYLGMRELCTCARVSKSWCSLAEDNVLWCHICHSLGYETSVEMRGHVCWKVVVREVMLRRKKVEKNWKERICGLSDHQPDSAGVLCCAAFSSQQVLTCYSSGAVFCWDLDTSEGPTRVRQPPSPTPFHPSHCDLSYGWGVVGTRQGQLQVVDTETCSQVLSLTNLGYINSVSVAGGGGVTAIAAASYHTFPALGDQSDVLILVAGGEGEEGWERSYLRLPQGHDAFKVTKVALVPVSGRSPYAVLYSTLSTLSLQRPHTPYSSALHILTSAGERGASCVNCFDHTPSTVACGTSAFGYRVQLYDLSTGAHSSSLSGHGQEVLCVGLANSPPNCLVSGSADKRVRVFDCRCSQSSLTMRGHPAPVCSVQMDEWKVISGSLDGTLIVWDQRMGGELWRTHERSAELGFKAWSNFDSPAWCWHPVALCRFEGSHLMAAHVPVDKHPAVMEGNPHLLHRRQRGLLRVMDFSVDPLYYTRRLPSICSSAYDEPSASFYALDLRVPYDTIA